MYPILTRYGSFFLYSLTVVLSGGIFAGLALAAWRARRLMINADWLDISLFGLVTGLIGGRMGFVWLEGGYFGARPYQIFQFWRGGLTYHGVLLAGLLGGWGWCVLRKRSFLQNADLLAPSIALASAFGWLACWLDGCGYGREAPAGSLFAANLPDHLGVFAWRYQTQLLGVGLSLLVFVLVLLWSRRWVRGESFFFVLFALSLGRVGLGFLRGDTAVLINSIRLDTLLDATLTILSLILLQYSHIRNKIVNH